MPIIYHEAEGQKRLEWGQGTTKVTWESWSPYELEITNAFRETLALSGGEVAELVDALQAAGEHVARIRSAAGEG